MHNARFRQKDWKRLSALQAKGHHILEKIQRHIPKKTYNLTQSDFEKGTFRITKPGKYILKENITFAPNPKNDFRPLSTQRDYAGRPFSLGFFAAITIEVDGVEIDLNRKTLRQSDKMAWMQRFYANIETASTAFISGQGPGKFGKSILSPKYIYIHNGTLGRSSHHGIHGNGNQYVLIENVVMVDYEFVGSAINGGTYIVHRNCKILHNFKDLKVLATWSAALFALQFSDAIAKNVSDTSNMDAGLFNEFSHSHLRLRASIRKAKKELFANRIVSNDLFRNEKKLADGNVYGILTNPLGVAIHAFASKQSMKELPPASHFFVENCEIQDLEGDVDEVVGFVNKNKKAQKGLSGDLLKLADCTYEDGSYRSNEISDMIFSLAAIQRTYPTWDYGTLHIDTDVLRWSHGELSFAQLTERGYLFQTGQDSMGHTGKGVLGIRIDGTNNVVLANNTVKNITNHARLGAEFNKSTDKTYLGTITAGIHVAYSRGVWIEKTLIENIRSYNGEASGIKGINTSKLFLHQSSVRDIESGLQYKEGEWTGRNYNKRSSIYRSTQPNEFPSVKGVCWSHDSTVYFEDIQIETLKGPQVFYVAIIE
uniref:Uncharacterized protein n=1 Tax=Pithovirus LCPAC304 TaxID=2506594 RepID=A0A481Z8D4_9VIRU|nr:MAG: hypothetical protein LCPAC304_05250 [Pithovirus LCPAC304]